MTSNVSPADLWLQQNLSANVLGFLKLPDEFIPDFLVNP